jgi:hypothetical protein
METESENKKDVEYIKKWEAKQTFEGRHFGTIEELWPLSSSTFLCKTQETLRVIDTASRNVLKEIGTLRCTILHLQSPSWRVRAIYALMAFIFFMLKGVMILGDNSIMRSILYDRSL